MFLSVHISENNGSVITEWPYAEGLPFKGACGCVGPDVEANWITKTLDRNGNFERLISRHSKDSATAVLISHGFEEKAVRVWADRYYI